MAALTDTIPLALDEHGVYRVGGTRVIFDLVVRAHKRGETPEQIAEDYSTLKLPDVYQVIGYYLKHSEELDVYLMRREREERELLAAHPEWQPKGLKERLLARKKQLACEVDH